MNDSNSYLEKSVNSSTNNVKPVNVKYTPVSKKKRSSALYAGAGLGTLAAGGGALYLVNKEN